MACPIRFAGVVRASAPRRLPDVRDGHGAWRRAKHNRNAGRGTIACRIAWPDFAASDAAASERES
ncbi:hypothetical protein HT746_08390 [Burkholderia pyrrocinia]|uniref:hypothetical protein n=1 Tax=Burkholderia pyrrocinia TaxID=60550 RepID=UPI0015769AC6|nr:hypothetical protein [Burkholderia pyrrocinia]NTX27150.1 hypothetical protein [Burkholderia pyrrocinia]QVN20522.1 hypothetical protein JYG32_28560 [Burkholderia pyrrocinia]